MPGLKQLETFSKDIQNLGNEIEIRATRGEKPPVLPLPQGISEEDDSQDFVLGLPESESPDDAVPDAPVDPDAAPSLEDLMTTPDETAAESAGPDFDDILAPAADTADDLPDLSEFENDVLPPEEPVEIPLEDQGLDALLQPAASGEELPEIPEDATEFSDMGGVSDIPDFSDIPDAAPSESDLSDIPDLQTTLDNIGVDDGPVAADALDEEPVAAEPAGSEPADSSFQEPAEEPADDGAAFDMPAQEDASGDDGLPSLDNLPSDLDMPAPDSGENQFQASSPAEAGSGEAPDSGDAFSVDDLLPDLDSPGNMADQPAPEAEAAAPAESEGASLSFDTPLEPAGGEAASPDSFDLDGLGSLDAGNLSLDGGSVDLPDVDSLLSGLDSESPAPAGEAETAPAGAPPSPGEELPLETFDAPEMEGIDFSGDVPSESPAGDDASKDLFSNLADEFPVTGESSGDFELDTDFEIPGITDTDIADLSKKKVDTPDFSKAEKDRPRTSLTEDEYERFKSNLAAYPLNLRIAIEDMIAKNEYTDDAVFEVIEKVLKKVPARSLAGHMEKMLDIAIDVPRDFERRSVAQYEAYKQSFQYQLKNRILPGAIVAVILTLIGFGLFRAGYQFIYKPAKAASLYKQGYTMLENNEYPQSELLFDRAVSYKPVKKWFFTYARGYRDHKQYERAADMYRRTLRSFKHDKAAGLEYAEMELYDRANYSRAEEIVRREVLDYHINDADGMLLLGDVFLEWADVEAEKYEDARAQYATLIQLYGGTDLYLSRMMRYFIRTDKLSNVLELKNVFYASKNKKALGADDWTELSGYLLDKLYGPLSKSEEYLRSSIEDVLDMLNTAIKLAPENPVGHYNLARYFLENGNYPASQRELETALNLFADAPVRTRRNAYKEIDCARILGERYAADREYLKAQTAYTRGINVYNDEHARAGLVADENTGRLFADMGDLDYFITGDMPSALYNYRKAVGMYNDTPSLNYRIGAIHYNDGDYDEALASFIKTAEMAPADANLLLALANTLAQRGDNYAAQGYYTDLLGRLNQTRREILRPQQDEDDGKLVDLYLKVTNNLGVTLYYLARQSGNSSMNAQAMVRLSDSMRAWDALTRNPRTMRRLAGSNLAAQNSKYITHPYPDFEPAIYTDIAKVLSDEQELE